MGTRRLDPTCGAPGGGGDGIGEDLVNEMRVERPDRFPPQRVPPHGGSKRIAPPGSGVIVPRPGKPPQEVARKPQTVVHVRAPVVAVDSPHQWLFGRDARLSEKRPHKVYGLASLWRQRSQYLWDVQRGGSVNLVTDQAPCPFRVRVIRKGPAAALSVARPIVLATTP